MSATENQLTEPATDTDNADGSDVIHPDAAKSLYGLMHERVRRSPEHLAYRHFDEKTESWQDTSWRELNELVARWHAGLSNENLKAGDRVAICMHNCIDWVAYELAAQSLGLVTISLYPNDRPNNMAYILENSGARVFLVEKFRRWEKLIDTRKELPELQTVLCVSRTTSHSNDNDAHVQRVADWLPDSGTINDASGAPDSLATIVYTSGTTGRPKGVMLSHYNILWNAWAGLQHLMVYPSDLALSFLPLSHTLERTIGFILPMMAGASVAFNRSIPELAEDLQIIKPTMLVSVPRIFERIYMKIHDGLKLKPAPVRWLFKAAVNTGWKRFETLQGRSRSSGWKFTWPLYEKLFCQRVQQAFGGRLRFAISGGAPLSFPVAQTFIALGINIQQGYGLTETSPVISGNNMTDNRPETVGTVFRDTQVRIGEDDELQVKSPGVMMGYWNNHTATYQTIDTDGWLHTGDKAKIDEDGHITITGRLKEIIVLNTGEKVPPADIEMAIAADSLFEQVLVIGEGHPFLSVLVVLNKQQHEDLLSKRKELSDKDANSTESKKYLLQHIFPLLHDFPGYAQVFGIAVIDEPWTVENELMTPTLKLKRNAILEKHKDLIEQIYEDHEV